VEQPREAVRADADPSGPDFPAGLGAATFRRIVRTPLARRVALGRLAFFTALVAGGLVVAIVGGAAALRHCARWLGRQDEFQLAFTDIVLAPDPPPWIKSGKAGLLERVRSRARLAPVLTLLDLDLKALAADFQRESPWVRAVGRIERAHPARLVVNLVYRRPVARIALGRGEIIVDRDGVVLPDDDIELESAGPLVHLALPAPPSASSYDALSGRALKIVPAPGATPDAEPARMAAALAAFLQDQPADRIVPAGPFNFVHYRGGELFLQTAGDGMILWGAAPGLEAPGEPSADAKLTLLREWIARHGTSENRYPRFLAFDKNRVVVREPRP
jgi:hypothetical protein